MVDHKSSLEPSADKPKLGVLIHSFFVIPFVIAVAAVLLYTSVRLLTAEEKTAHGYLNDVKVGGLTKRWQAAFELSKILSNPNQAPQDDAFVSEMTAMFAHSIHDDLRVRQYLAIAMGRSGQTVYVPVLLEALKSAEEPAQVAVIYALGLLKDDRAVPALEAIYDHGSDEARLAVIMALGDIGDPESLPVLKAALGDANVNIRWDSAVALAKMKDTSGKMILMQMLDRSYWEQYPEVDLKERLQARLVAIKAAALLDDRDLNDKIRELSQHEPNIHIRRVALDVLG